jgi:hypothetical protein
MSYASVRGKLTPGMTTTIVPATDTLGYLVLVSGAPPAGSNYDAYYNVLVYIGVDAGATKITLPAIAAGGLILLVDLPNGIGTSLAEIAAAITDGGYGGVPQGIGPQPTFASYASNPTDLAGGTSYAFPPAATAVAAGTPGTLLLVPQSPPAGSDYGSFYTVLAYVATNTTTAIALPSVAGILRLDVPNGIFTPSTEIAAAITTGGSGGPPTGVDGT